MRTPRGSSSAAQGDAADRYQRLEEQRRPFLERARAGAALTIPTLSPDERLGGARDLPTPYQGVGARGVNALSNKLLLALFPPDAPFFRLSLGDGAEPEPLTRTPEDHEEAALVRQGLRRLERRLAARFETGLMRAGLHSALKQLIVAGNVLIHLPPEGGVRVFRLDRYVVARDAFGREREIIVKDVVAPEDLPIEAQGSAHQNADRLGAKTVPLYTVIRRENDRWRVWQETGGQVIESSRGAYPEGAADWLALRWSHVDGEDYGRGHVEEYAGDLKSLEGLMQAVVEGAAMAARMTVLVAPNGQTDAEALAEAENGAIIDGVAKDVSILTAGKAGDFRVALDAVEMLSERLAFAFLLKDAARRQGDQVTAEEIRLVAAELESGLGGVYSVLAEELQAPLVQIGLRHMADAGAAPDLPPGSLRPKIVTGLDALGRGRELDKLEALLGFTAKLSALAETPAGARLDLDAAIRRAAEGLGVETDAFMRPVAAEAQTPDAPAPEGPAPLAEAPEAEAAGVEMLGALAPAIKALAAGVGDPTGNPAGQLPGQAAADQLGLDAAAILPAAQG